MTGGHRAFKSTLDQVQRRAFWFHWRRDVQRCCRQCQNCLCYHRGCLPRWGPPVNYLSQRSKKSRPIIAHVDKLKAWDTDNPSKSWLVPATSQQRSTGEVANQNVAENEEQSRDEPEPGPSGRNVSLPSDEVSAARDPNPVERRQVPTDGAGTSNSAPRDGPTPSQCPDDVGAAIAGDPQSTQQRLDRPRRTIRRPTRYKD